MFVCKKCGAHVEDDLKYCDKCGSENSVPEEQTTDTQPFDDVKETIEKEHSHGIIEQIENVVHSFLPHPFTKQGDRTSLMIGLGSLAALAITYIICFFSFMPEMCLPVSIGVSGVDGASSLWIVAHFVFGLFPVFFLVKAFLAKKYRIYAAFVSAAIFVITLFSLIFWGMCEPANYEEAVMIYGNSPGSIAWFAFVDCLSEAWYLKLILSVASVFGFGVDYIINKGN